nr:hypothetical protein [Microctonus hyperodae filamentous virus]
MNKVNELTTQRNEMLQMKMEFQEREHKYQNAIKDLTLKANMTLTEFGVQGLLARDNIADNEQLRNIMTSVQGRVIPEMSNRPEKEHYVASYELDVELLEKKTKRGQNKNISFFEALQLVDEDDCIARCLTPSLEAKEHITKIIRETLDQINKQMDVSPAKRDPVAYTPDDIVHFVNNYTFNFNYNCIMNL